jgi:uncharacterized protein
MSNLQQQLAYLRERIASVGARAEPEALPKDQTAGLARWLDGVEVQTEAGCHFEATRHWPRHQRHGSMDIVDLQQMPAGNLGAITQGEIAAVDPRRIAFLDTETTGLAGGSGTYAFLIGAGSITDHGFELKQFFLRDYADEPSQLTALAEYLAGFEVLVTYNGKTYDQPLLETRYRMTRMRSPFARMRHLDLLHGARRLYKLQFASCRLVELEQQILGVERDDDVPGNLIPLLYFEYLRTKDAHRLASIFEHNAYDILTLACLTGIIPRAFEAPLEVPLHRGAEMVGLGRWLRAAGRHEEAAALLRRAIGAGLKDELLWRTVFDCAALEKKCGRMDGALALYSELTTAANPFQAQAFEEIAKHYEHAEKNFALALEFAEQACRLAPGAATEARRERLRKRVSRKASGRLL